MRTNSDLILLDAGNTHLKVAHVLNGEIFDLDRISFGDKQLLEIYFQELKEIPKALTSVLSKEQTLTILSIAENCKVLNRNSELPISLDYHTPKTLGFDRICNASAISVLSKTKNTVSIDIGTCIKFDFVEGKTYKGGSISPGIRLRYNSLNDYTANLPLLTDLNSTDLIGKSTTSSIHSGVINGIQAEISGMIQRYEQEFKDLTFFVTGGDAQYFDFVGKNNIFANENLTLKGLYEIYQLNAQ